MNDLFKQYSADIKRFPKLSREETQKLIEQFHNGDWDAYKRLVECNLQFVVWAYFRKPYRPGEIMDYIQAGNCGLMKAICKYNPDKGAFHQYALMWIDNAFKREWAKNGHIVRLTIPEMLRYRQYEAVTDETFSEHEITTFKRYKKAKDCVPLYQKIKNDKAEIESFELIEQAIINFELNEERRLLAEEIKDILEPLKPKEKRLLIQYFGLDGNKPMTMQEIGNELGRSRQDVSATIQRIIIKIRKDLS